MQGEPTERDLQLLAEDAFRVFGSDPTVWPDRVEINRSGFTDANIRGFWSFEDRTEFFHVLLPATTGSDAISSPTGPDSPGTGD